LEIDKPVQINWEFNIKDQGVYSFHMQADNEAEIYADGQLIEKVTDWSKEAITNIFLENGNHSLKAIVINRSGAEETWDKNPGGIAILVKNKSGEKIFGSRDYASPIPDDKIERNNVSLNNKESNKSIEDRETNILTNTSEKRELVNDLINRNSSKLPTIAEVQKFITGQWYISKGEGPGGLMMVKGIFEITTTHIRAIFGKVIGSPNKYTILSIRPTSSGLGYFIDIKIDRNKASSISEFEEWMVKPSGSIVIRRPGITFSGPTKKDMFLEIIRL
jgi:hypothetical protein